MLRIVLLTTLVALAASDTADINKVVDDLLSSVQETLQDEIAIPDVSHDWHQKWHFIKVKGNFNCHGGKFRSLKSIRRTGDCMLTTEGDKITLNVKLGLAVMDAKFGRCQVKIHRIGSMSSKVDVSVGSNSVDAQISLKGAGSSCVATLDHVVLNQLGRITIHTGGGLFHKVENKILDVVAKHMHSQVTGQVNKALTEAAQKALARTNLCNKIPHGI